MMMYFCLFASLFLLGLTSAENVTSCLIEDKELQLTCKVPLLEKKEAVCTFKTDDKVVATNAKDGKQDPEFKDRATVTVTPEKKVCVLNLKQFKDGKSFTCTVKLGDKQEEIPKITLEKKNLKPCSAGSVVQYGGAALLVALLLPLLSQLL